ncbi:YjgN family protein [Pseudocitrobacter cyperus]|uniref:DUF898 family protein n=1 Tax=Pseudocitrobacter cyperus TaxID=3112843 RepID=A0ABV0HNA2_9ENTR
MNDIVNGKHAERHKFVFTGKGWQFFIISLVNVLLVCITLGIYLPWAVVKCRRYVYSHMSLNGQVFSYKATGGAILASFLLVIVVYALSFYFISREQFVIGSIILGMLILSIPFMIVKSLQYQAMMTSLNGINFSFECSMLKAWLYLFALPFIIEVILGVVLYFVFSVTGFLGVIPRLILLGLVMILGLGVVNGVVYGKWMTLMGNGGHFGIHRFSIQISIKQCIKGCVLALSTLLPFIVVIGYLISPVFMQLLQMSIMGGEPDTITSAIIMENYSRIMTGYALYFIAILVVVSYMYSTLRNLFLNHLTLANETLHFHSSITGSGMFLRMLMVMVVSSITLGLAYPWLKMYLVGWMARNTYVIGDLDALELVNGETPQNGGFLMWISRGIMPYVPFI